MPFTFSQAFVITSNVLLSVSLVMANKVLVERLDFPFMSVLTGLHYLSCMLLCLVLLPMGCMRYKLVKNYFFIFRIALGALLSTLSMNYCLAHSSIGFYQVSKLGCIPVTLLIESILGCRKQRLTSRLIAGLVLVTVGMMLVIQQEISYSPLGLLWGIAGIASTSTAQIFFGPLKKELDLDALQLLFHSSPWLSFGSFISTIIIPHPKQLWDFPLNGNVVGAIALTCALAALFNLSNYSILGQISPLSYIVFGHVKTLLIIALGSLVFETWPSARMSAGMALAVVGVAVYTVETEAQANEADLVRKSSGTLSREV
eukprot:gene4390-4811_t